MGKLKCENNLLNRRGNKLIHDEQEGNNTKNHELPIQDLGNRLKMLMFALHPMLEAMEDLLEDKGKDDEDNDKAFRKDGVNLLLVARCLGVSCLVGHGEGQ